MGLGNPGSEYRNTRHNIGFRAVDALAKRLGCKLDRTDAGALVGRAPHPGAPDSATVLLAEPQTYMNLSGRSASGLLRNNHLQPAQLWLVYDEMDLEFGRVRMRLGGSPGGHNGVRSVVDAIGTRDIPRVRLGVAHPDEGEPVDHLLSPFSREERERVPLLVQLGADAILAALTVGFEIAMNEHNGKSA